MLYKHFPNFLNLDVALSIPVASFLKTEAWKKGSLKCAERLSLQHTKGILKR